MELKITIEAEGIETIRTKINIPEEKNIKFRPEPHYSVYARFFDRESREYRYTYDDNKLFLIAQQDYFNMLLRYKKFVLLNNVYDALGLPRNEEPSGVKIGWVYHEDDNSVGDNYIDFGLFNPYGPWSSKQDFLLDFNVDGDISKYLIDMDLA